MYQLTMLLHVLSAVCLIVLVLVQQGKGATVGATFGAGASQTLFGSRGAGSFLLKITLGFVFVFFSTSIALNWMSAHSMKQQAQESRLLPLPLRQSAEQALPPPSSSASSVSVPPGRPAASPPETAAPGVPLTPAHTKRSTSAPGAGAH